MSPVIAKPGDNVRITLRPEQAYTLSDLLDEHLHECLEAGDYPTLIRLAEVAGPLADAIVVANDEFLTALRAPTYYEPPTLTPLDIEAREEEWLVGLADDVEAEVVAYPSVYDDPTVPYEFDDLESDEWERVLGYELVEEVL